MSIYANKKVKIWVDDIRPVPQGYEGTKSVEETIALIEEIEEAGGEVELLDLDHDLGDYAEFGGDAIKILDFWRKGRPFILLQFIRQIRWEEQIWRE